MLDKRIGRCYNWGSQELLEKNDETSRQNS